MMLRTLCSMVVLGGVITVARADPVDLGPVQMDAVTAAGADAYNAHAVAQANANGENAFTGTFSNAVALDGLLPKLPSYGGGSQAAAIAAATGPSAYIEASAKADYGAVGEAIAHAAATGPSAFAAISAGVVNINGQDYLTGSLAGGDPSSVKAITSTPIALSTSGIAWSPPAVRPATSAPAWSVASTEMPGGQFVIYTLIAGDQSGNTPTGDSATLSLSFFKPPHSRIPPFIPIGISGAIPVTTNTLAAKPVAM